MIFIIIRVYVYISLVLINLLLNDFYSVLVLSIKFWLTPTEDPCVFRLVTLYEFESVSESKRVIDTFQNDSKEDLIVEKKTVLYCQQGEENIVKKKTSVPELGSGSDLTSPD